MPDNPNATPRFAELADAAEAKLARHESLTPFENGAYLLRVWEGADPDDPAMGVRFAVWLVGSLMEACVPAHPATHPAVQGLLDIPENDLRDALALRPDLRRRLRVVLGLSA